MHEQITTTALARLSHDTGLDWLQPQSLDGALALAKELANAEIVPKEFIKKPANILIAMAVGRRLGLDAVTSMSALYVRNGKAGLTADTMAAFCKNHPDCIYFSKVEESDQAVTWETQRRGSPAERCTVTIQQAIAAGWAANNPQYKTNPRRMLSARAKSFLARDVYPDLLMGLPSKEELEDERLADAEQKHEEYKEAKSEKETFAERARTRARQKLAATVKIRPPEPEEPAASDAVVTVDAEVEGDLFGAPEATVDAVAPIGEDGANGRRYIANWREFTTEADGRLFVSIMPHGPKAGTKLAAMDAEMSAAVLEKVHAALQKNQYEAAALGAEIDWLTPEELRAMDQALANTLELATRKLR